MQNDFGRSTTDAFSRQVFDSTLGIVGDRDALARETLERGEQAIKYGFWSCPLFP
jgi:hypothetical protein